MKKPNEWEEHKPTMSHTFAINIYDPCPKCEAPLNPYHEKNGCSIETKKVKKVKKLVIVETLEEPEDDEDEEEDKLKCLGFRPQSRIGECEGCKAVCEECENLMIMEEEPDDEDIDVCGETGREFDLKNPVKGCGIKLRDDDENIMIGNISFCEKCANSPEGQKAMEDEDNDT